ncbi:DeoR/GlpR transcriptional regulator [Nitratireductor aquimarinus]|uniref:DeoR/GlpR family DNA-binding transcription regulator n=1 Tax=Nitratireductor aquimarinus TaxID=889300 RepID=UPI001A8CAF6F|nr:DeoR/GlpR family DNA-binding transcription regulator [Nitratireductor aquimarinus]MBN8243517.1 DeoR/GlpR transcriptional regulator [Nitratireductor aquimarinus]MBY6132234.1 DeoR/GlpR family DNA-binding transcription regulator [Nitratireductor aquimarinus]MCA1303269.1 DeoR/GlpR family DNA-binding transcription regulator [Nitratireductor aquimarinus]
MNYSPRHGRILDLLTEQGTMGVNDLAQHLEVSVETVRRDVKVLAGRGAIVRMHGAIALPSVVSEAPFERRMRENRQAKETIAALAASTIRDGESVMLDTGTTTSLLARALLDHRQLTVVTNSSDIARTLATVNGNKVYMAGGELRSDSGSALGFSAIEFVSRFSVDHAIISAGAVNAMTGIMDYDLEEAQFGNAVLARGRRRVVVTDASKFGRKGLVRVCSFAEVDSLIVDSMPPEDLSEALRLADVTVTCPA